MKFLQMEQTQEIKFEKKIFPGFHKYTFYFLPKIQIPKRFLDTQILDIKNSSI